VRYLAIVLSILIGSFATESAHACSCWHPSAESYLKAADVIFYGVPTKVTEVTQDSRPAQLAEFDVETWFKGPETGRIMVSTVKQDGVNCGWGFGVGRKVMVFANRHADGYSTGMCMMIPYTAPDQREAYDQLLPVYRDKVAALFRKVEKEPWNAAARVELAQYLEDWRDLERAALAWREAAAKSPPNPKLPWGEGRVLFALQRFEEAKAPLERALAIAPDNTDVRRLLFQARLKTGAPFDAAEANFKDGDFAGLSLADRDLHGRDFSGAKLDRPLLARANLAGANFTNANLYHADLSGADLRHARLDGLTSSFLILQRADLAGASIVRGELSHGVLVDAKFTNAIMTDARLWSAVLAGADFSGADLSRAKLYGSNAADTDFADANLRNADFRNANLRGTDLSRATLDGAMFSGAMYDCRTRFAQGFDPRTHHMLPAERDCGGKPTNHDYSGYQLRQMFLTGMNLSGVSFRGANLEHVYFVGCDLTNADFRDANVNGGFRGSDLSGADFTNAKLSVGFYGVESTGPGSKASKLTGTKFAGVRLRTRDFVTDRTDSQSADMESANLKGAIIDGKVRE
jgi:uncharacterized protein YjbI with pentapeptide repeats